MRPEDFDFDLPEELIALSPAAVRHDSRLLHVRGNGLGHHRFADLPDLLREGDLLVLNNTKVFPAALTVTRPARMAEGADVSVDLTLLRPIEEEAAFVTWRAFARPAKRLKEGDRVFFGEGGEAEILSRAEAEVKLRVPLSPTQFLDLVHAHGAMPLPPYIARKRPAGESDMSRYQTVYAEHQGSVAAPTAGLHFTDEVFAALAAKGIEKTFVTLHVGAGTFLPVSVDRIEDHKMHAEWGEVSPQTARTMQKAMDEGRRIVCVGTTSTRLVESAATGPRQIAPFQGETDIFITPGHDFQIVDALITNFHLPRSTLLMLVSALSGRERMLDAYAEAIHEKYRFYSYGDACLLERAHD